MIEIAIAKYWDLVTSSINQVVKHVDQGLCVRPSPNKIPLKLCVRPAIEGSHCCTRHQQDCPMK